MQKSLAATIGSAALAMTMNFATPAAAQVAGPQTATPLTQLSESNAKDLVTKVQRRRAWRGRGHWRGNRHWARRHWRHRHWGYHRWHGDNWGPAVGAGIAGLFLGGALAAQAQASGDAIDWCDRRYRSYDRRTQTYLGYDGYRHSCP